MDIIESIDHATGCQQCGADLSGSVSDDFCSEECQRAWQVANVARVEQVELERIGEIDAVRFGVSMNAVAESARRLSETLRATGLTMSQLALAWILRRRNVASAIVGATRPEQVSENVAAAGVTLSDDTLRAIDDALDPVAIR